MEDELTAGGRCVDTLLQTTESNIPVLELRDLLNQVFQAAAEPIEPPNDDRIAVTKVVKCFGKAGTFSFPSAGNVREDLSASSFLQSIFLEVDVLILG